MSAAILLGLIAAAVWWVAGVDRDLMDDIDPDRRTRGDTSKGPTP
jgi:hypothetical protein